MHHKVSDNDQTSGVSSSTLPERRQHLSVSIAICTRSRSGSIIAAITSVLESGASFEELVIIDQSPDNATEDAVQPFLANRRVRYMRSNTVGIGISRNIALESVESEILVFVDDDCTVLPNWLDAHMNAFREHPKVAMTFGVVEAVEHDTLKGFIPAYLLTTDRYVRTFRDKQLARGIGANAALRKAAMLIIGGYDPVMGVGGKFLGCEDGDLAIRSLMLGFEIYECSQSKVLHYGFRDWAAGRKGTLNDFIGIGAACAKPFKCGRWESWPFAYEEGINRAVLPFITALIRCKPPLGFSRVRGFFHGFVLGMRTPVDPVSRHFNAD